MIIERRGYCTITILSVFCALFLSASWISADGTVGAETIVEYEPATVSLNGRIREQTFPGPPNYRSLQSGDEAETYWMLDLDQPISVKTPKNDQDGLYPSEKGIRTLQLAFVGTPYPKVGTVQFGKRYRVTGSLMHAISGHHHSDVLIMPKHIEAIK